MDKLLSVGANINATVKLDGATPLTVAAYYDSEWSKLLDAKADPTIACTSSGKLCALDVAQRMVAICPGTTNHKHLVEALLPSSRQVKFKSSPYVNSSRQSPPRARPRRMQGQANQRLLNACQQGQFAAVQDCIAQGADLEATKSIRGEKQTPLLLAIGSTQLRVMHAHLTSM